MPTTTSHVSDLVALRGGLAVPVEALRILWALEARAFDVRLADDGALLVAPGSKLTTDDRAAIAEHRDALRALVAYCEEPIADRVL
jgi:hypothetical protein